MADKAGHIWSVSCLSNLNFSSVTTFCDLIGQKSKNKLDLNELNEFGGSVGSVITGVF